MVMFHVLPGIQDIKVLLQQQYKKKFTPLSQIVLQLHFTSGTLIAHFNLLHLY